MTKSSKPQGGSPLLGQGGVDATLIKMSRSLLCWSGRGGSFNYRLFGGLNQPPRLRGTRRLREILLIAQPPLLIQGGDWRVLNVRQQPRPGRGLPFSPN